MPFSHRLLMAELQVYRLRVASEEGDWNSGSDWREWRRVGCAMCDRGQLGERWRLRGVGVATLGVLWRTCVGRQEPQGCLVLGWGCLNALR